VAAAGKMVMVDHVELAADVLIVLDNLMDLNVAALVMMLQAGVVLVVDIGLEDVVEILDVTVKVALEEEVVVIMGIV
jgi:hypothetical protein